MASWIFRRMTPIIAAAGLARSFESVARCQPSGTKRPAFAVASVKLDKTCENPFGRRPTMNPVTFRLPCFTAKMLIRTAYSGVSETTGFSTRQLQVVGGPAWVESEIYSIDAKPETKSTAAEMMGPMLQSLLEDRFRLKIHLEPRETPVYFLTVATPSPKLRPMREDECFPIDLFQVVEGPRTGPDPDEPHSAPKQCDGVRMSPSPYGIAWDLNGWTMAEFTRQVASKVGRPVIDNTGLKGRFELRVEFDSRLQQQGPVLLNGQEVVLDNSTESAPVSISAALRKQLGLKLTPGKAQLDVIVVDQVERPSEN
jgi:uncharacterized protein (TIGR03435 family)